MAHILDGANLKLSRADKHIRVLERQIRNYLRLKPYCLSREDKGEYVAFVFRVTKHPPETLPLLIGECLYQMRSALDNSVYAINRSLGGNESDTGVEFPVFIEEKDFEEWGFKKIKRLRSAGHKAYKLIVDAQPFQHGKFAAEHPFWQLHQLNIFDKHRRLNTVIASALNSQSRLFTGDIPGAGNVRHIAGGIFRDGTEHVAFNVSMNDAIRYDLRIQANFAPFVALDELSLGYVPLYGQLLNMSQATHRLISSLA
jgi:hypothetical protein